MTLADFFTAIAQLAGLLFIVTSMLAMGMSLTMPMILQPLKNVRLVVLALLANFVLVPLLAYVITVLIPLEQSLKIGLIVLSTAAGAPFLPKLVQGAKGNIALGVGLMVLLVVGLGLNIANIIDLIGSGGIVALLLFIVGSLLIGLVLGGRDPQVRSVMGLGTAQRNVSAAILVSAQNFSGTNTLSFVLVAAIVLLLILLPTAKRLGARMPATSAAAPAAK
jgi:BASS family bile acid:Na+ symporter